MQLLEKGKDIYFLLRNADGKEWLIPKRHMRTALEIYQPSGWKGIWLKRVLPYVVNWAPLRRYLHIEQQQAQLQGEICQLINQAFGEKDFEFAIFYGTPCVHQKATIQIFKDETILGYGKLTDKETVYHHFKREEGLLNDLNKHGMSGIPTAISCGKTNSGLFYFVQTTMKTRHSSYPHQWNERHERFIEELHIKTRATLLYKETDYHVAVEKLKNRINWLTELQQRTVNEAIKRVEQGLGEEPREWSAYHADFTPWNMFVEQGQLFVFDWEYALRSCPPKLDRYHFFTQSEIFEKHQEIEGVIEEFRKKGEKFNQFDYLCYLLINLAIYIGRENDASGVANEVNIARQIKLIECLMKTER